ncbi:hypothetical protein FE257_007304 [Aspergillus nanangensis]|uniref:Copper-fist domain-containing protein n=1 Tax=Aspergillus nanangensis TaxID=2582783 RepID=A0AAD4CNC6_ASPNN|nr:hypothetical protein FE257_007304 [Aspergillus nanangensis]
MLIDGEKWACEACVRGHRVSSCHHSDRPLTHINKKGRPVSQCAHCRGLRKSRTTHTKCDCGDKKKNSHKHDSDPHAVDKRDLKREHVGDEDSRCGCLHGQRCTCALKKETHLDPVPETGLPPPPHAILSEPPKKPQLTSTKSDSTLMIFRDGHHKPAHKHNDMAHKCGLPYTIPRSHTIHGTCDVARRSVDHLPLTQAALMSETFSNPRLPGQQHGHPSQRRVKSEHGSPEAVPTMSADHIPSTVPPLDLSSFFPHASTMDKTNDADPASISMGETPLNPLMTSMPLDVTSYSNFQTTTASPVNCMAAQDPFNESFFHTSEGDVPLNPAPFSAPPVDWSSFPLYTDAPAATSTQAPSYASFDYNANNTIPGFAAPSSSGDISEVEDYAPLSALPNDLHDLHSGSEGSDIDHFRISSASSFIGLPQTQLLSSNHLESINIDDFLKTANESTAALEHQLQANMGMDSKALPPQETYPMPDSQGFKPMTTEDQSLPMTTTAPNPAWPAAMFEPGVPMDDNGDSFLSRWAQ